MIKWKFLVFLLLFNLTLTGILAQGNVSGLDVDLQEKTPQSPNAGSLGKYFEIPVNMATGLPNISIPLYTIKTGNITVPIVLSYHPGGVQVDDIASWVGTNWTLSAGGSVVKKTNGLDDFYATSGIGSGTPNQNYTNPSYSNIPYNAGYNTMSDALDVFRTATTMSAQDSINKFFSYILKGFLDGEADEFNYSMPGDGGKFYYNQKKGVFQCGNINGSVVSGGESSWMLIAKDGKVYSFGVTERTVNPSFLKTGSYQQFLTTAWHLNHIEDPVTGKDVLFKYTNYYKSNISMGVFESKDYDNTSGPMYMFASNMVDNWRSGDNYVLDTIFFNTGAVCFVKDPASRPDNGPNTLKELRIINNNGVLLKKFVFNYFYDNNRLFLSSVQETEYDGNGNNLVHPPYSFNYESTYHLPARFSFAQDKWGYYNGKVSNTTSIPSHPYASIYPLMTAADRSIDSNYTKTGMLNTIVYPTGGRSVFDFENNRIGTNTLVGGMRIRRITHTDPVAQKNLVTEYSYVVPGGSVSSGEVTNMPVYNYDLYHFSGDVMTGFNYHFLYRMESTPVNSLFPNQGSPIFYGVVEKREKSSEGDLLSRHYFQKITEAGEIYDNTISVPHPKQLDVKDLLETNTEIYKKEPGTSTYTLIQKDSIETNTLVSTQNSIWNVQGAWTFIGDRFSEWPGGDPVTLYPMTTYFAPSLHAYKVMPCLDVTTTQYTNTIANGITLKTPTFYEYDSTNGNLKLMKSVDSKGDTTIKMIKYAGEYISTPSPSANFEIEILNEHNMKSAPVEVISLFKAKNATAATVQSALLYEYEGLKVKKIYKVFDQLPFSSFTVSYNNTSGFYKDSHYQLQQEVTAWDGEGRPQTVITNTNAVSYIWDGAYQQPTGIVNNASYQDVAYTSFEGSGNGNWTVNSASRDFANRVTGKKSYLLSNGSITKGGLTSSKTYLVSYWSRNGSGNSYSITGTSSVKEGRTVKGWTYFEHTVSGVNSITITGANFIDELRLYPQNAQMSSYCYEELLGVISQCDAGNHISYYEYKGPEKLTLIRDQDNNILKKICYNYAGQVEDCTSPCTDTVGNWQNTTTALRCQQGTCGNTGYQEQEQKNINACSPTYNQTRWVLAGYNPSACPASTCLSLTSTNVTGATGYTATYVSTAPGGPTYTFAVPATTGLQTLGSLPAGTYNLTITRTIGIAMYGTFKSGCYKQIITGSSATFSNVNVSSTTCNSITVDISAL